MTPGRGKEYMEIYSNLAYNLAGFVAFAAHGDLPFCIVMQVLGCGSLIYHKEKNKPIFMFDWWAMICVVTTLTAMIIGEDWGWYAAFGYMTVYAAFIIGKTKSPFIEVGIVVAPCLAAILVYDPFWKFLVINVVFWSAVWLRSKDPDPKQAKFHDSWEHSVWHIITAIGFYLAAYL